MIKKISTVLYGVAFTKKLKILFSTKKTKDIVFTKAKKAEVFFILKNVAVFFGGKAPEREISIITGVFVLNSIDKSKFNPIPFFIDGDGTFFTGEKLFNLDFYKTIDRKLITECSLLAGENKIYTLKRGKLKSAVEIYAGINCIHGRYGEDGSLLGLTTFCDIPLVSPGIFAESFSIDKDFTKLLLKALEIKQVE